jgi:hypothetical protein
MRMIETYRVSGKRAIVEKITEALVACGVEVVRHPNVNEAPFTYSVKLPGGQRLELLVYAFLANKYGQRGRPADEHRFQVKYGSDFHRAHELFIDPTREVVTLFLGVHLEAGIFIGADPAMHTPTWFSSSIEFKDEHVSAAQSEGWLGWERDRSSARRRAGREPENHQTETLIAFAPHLLLRFIQLERLATGLDAGERLLLADKLAAGAVERETEHPLERQFGLSAREILDVIWGRFRLGVAVRGGVAEHHLGSYLRAQSGISAVRGIDEDGRADFEIVVRDRPLLVECKNVLRQSRDNGQPRVDFQKTRASKDNPCSRYYEAQAFDVLAACLHPITERWEFRFTRTSSLAPHASCEGRLSPRVVVAGDHWRADIGELLLP